MDLNGAVVGQSVGGDGQGFATDYGIWENHPPLGGRRWGDGRRWRVAIAEHQVSGISSQIRASGVESPNGGAGGLDAPYADVFQANRVVVSVQDIGIRQGVSAQSEGKERVSGEGNGTVQLEVIELQ